MLAPFLGFGPQAIDWFRGLEADNSKTYFEGSRGSGKRRARPLERLLEELAEELGGSARLFRPHRDVRFSKDKSPYKTHTYGVISVRGTQSGLYVSIGKGGLRRRQRLLADDAGPARALPRGGHGAGGRRAGCRGRSDAGSRDEALGRGAEDGSARGRRRITRRAHLLRMKDFSPATSSGRRKPWTAGGRRTSRARCGTARAK